MVELQHNFVTLRTLNNRAAAVWTPGEVL